MRSGAITPEVQTRELDRRDVAYSLWEEASGVSPELPWSPAAAISEDETALLLSKARTAAVVVGPRRESAALLKASFSRAAPACRIYCYASSKWEADEFFKSKPEAPSEHVLVRLGLDAPADWIVIDEGRAALLLLGPQGSERRWLVSVDGGIARSLYEAFRVLFWFHATRERLPDVHGIYAFRTPLPAPFPHPGHDVPLRAGRLLTEGALTDSIENAEIRVVPDGSAAGPSQVVFMPPDTNSFLVPMNLAKTASRVVWTDLGIPRTHVSRQRVVMDLIESPISLQLEWPKQVAVDLFHRLTKVAQRPAWQFHAERRLAEVAGRVLLAQSSAPQAVQDQVVVEAASVVVSPADFGNAQPAMFPEPPPLARRVTYRWNVKPTAPPVGAREAELVRRWRSVDEWARAQVDTLRQMLRDMEGEERGFLDRLRAWLPRNKEARRRRNELLARLDELGEAPPSRQPTEANEIVQQLLQVRLEVRQAIEELHADRVQAESAAAEAEQRAAWEARRREMQKSLHAKRRDLEALESQAAGEEHALAKARERLAEQEASLRAARKTDLEKSQAALAADCERARQALAGLPPDASKQTRKEGAHGLRTLEQKLQRLENELASLDRWSPPASELPEAHAPVQERLAGLNQVREQIRVLSREIEGLDRSASAAFVFEPPPPAAKPSSPAESAAPTIPAEELPELGELFEYQRTRYLAIQTWEQVSPAAPVAKRLRAELVCLPHNRR